VVFCFKSRCLAPPSTLNSGCFSVKMCRLTPSKVRVRVSLQLGLDAEWHRTDSVRSGLWEKKSGCRPQSTPEPFTFYAKSLQQPPHIVLNILPKSLHLPSTILYSPYTIGFFAKIKIFQLIVATLQKLLLHFELLD